MRRRASVRRAPGGLPAGTRALVARALREDRVRRDRTTRALLPHPTRATALVSAQAAGVLSGVRVAALVARMAGLRARVLRPDGRRVAPREAVLRLEGDARAILSVERTLLNFLMHLSGVASATRAAVGRAGPTLRILATRKTTPGLRDLEKLAVRHGGGLPHRRDLSDALLVKNNHLALLPLEEAVARAVRGARGRPVEVEVRSADAAVRAARAGARTLLVDNRGPAGARRIVRELERSGLRGRVAVELSGGITASNVARYRRVGADRASLGSLTHSAPALPFHLTVLPRGRRPPSRS